MVDLKTKLETLPIVKLLDDGTCQMQHIGPHLNCSPGVVESRVDCDKEVVRISMIDIQIHHSSRFSHKTLETSNGGIDREIDA